MSGLIQTVKLMLNRNYELSKDDYYHKFLDGEDATALKEFIEYFTQKSEDFTILAVGSSTFPKSHWKNRKKMNKINIKKDLRLSVPTTYEDIDLLIIPQAPMQVKPLKSSVEDILTDMHYKYIPSESTNLGTKYCKTTEGLFAPVFDTAYGMHSIMTWLNGGRQLDLILGREDLMCITAQEKIDFERKHNHSFVILYHPLYR